MAGIDSLLDMSRRSLINQGKALQVVGNNVSNVNTEGYSKRDIAFADRTTSNAGATSAGYGADVKEITRRVDDFINRALYGNTAEREAALAKDSIFLRAEGPFSVDETLRHIGWELSNFENALNDLQTDPGSIPLRSNLIDAGQSLTQAIRLTFNTLADLQREADNRIITCVKDINNTANAIADLNLQIGSSEIGQQDNLGLRDKRDQLAFELSKKVSFEMVEDSKGMVTVRKSNS